MSQPTSRVLSIAEVTTHMRSSLVRRSEVPIEAYVSSPLPTLRFGEPAYAFLVAAALRMPDRETSYADPDRFFVLSLSGRLLVYSTTVAIPVSPVGPIGEPFTVDTIAAKKKLQADLDASLEEAKSAYFAGSAADPQLSAKTLTAIAQTTPPSLLPFIRGLAADFFGWLEP